VIDACEVHGVANVPELNSEEEVELGFVQPGLAGGGVWVTESGDLGVADYPH
jgi:hypothetical protein